jgi:hypothetical protein
LGLAVGSWQVLDETTSNIDTKRISRNTNSDHNTLNESGGRPITYLKFGPRCLPRITITTQPNERSSELAINVIDDESR